MLGLAGKETAPCRCPEAVEIENGQHTLQNRAMLAVVAYFSGFAKDLLCGL
ncbi:hypothetical protein [Sporomusa termitida]|uniref:hypothetical protein n=1 Tax=Sporomusa termitida TaxID=2377 RepID=UPI0014788516|nr:hypothetical protein [Sporomusa termitida]